MAEYVGEKICEFLEEKGVGFSYSGGTDEGLDFKYIGGDISINLLKEIESKFQVSWDVWEYSDGKLQNVHFGILN